MRERLAEGGVFCQWLAGWQIGAFELESIAESLRAAFPHVAIWQLSRSDQRPLFALVAVEEPRQISRAGLQARMDQRRPPPVGAENVLRSANDVVAWYVGDWTPSPGVQQNTDEHPVVEFSAPMTQRHRTRRLLRATFHDYYESRLLSLSRRAFSFDPPAAPTERYRTR